MDTYIEKLTSQTVDSIAKSCEYIIDKALEFKNKNVFFSHRLDFVSQE